MKDTSASTHPSKERCLPSDREEEEEEEEVLEEEEEERCAEAAAECQALALTSKTTTRCSPPEDDEDIAVRTVKLSTTTQEGGRKIWSRPTLCAVFFSSFSSSCANLVWYVVCVLKRERIRLLEVTYLYLTASNVCQGVCVGSGHSHTPLPHHHHAIIIIIMSSSPQSHLSPKINAIKLSTDIVLI
jgi:hypothetical protein